MTTTHHTRPIPSNEAIPELDDITDAWVLMQRRLDGTLSPPHDPARFPDPDFSADTVHAQLLADLHRHGPRVNVLPSTLTWKE